MLRVAPGQFFGDARRSFASHGIRVTHRVADRPPEQVPHHTHSDAHFVLVMGGDYVSVAVGKRAAGIPVLIFNPAGTAHRDHFECGRGSFFAISLEPLKTVQVAPGASLPEGPVCLTAQLQHTLALRIASGDAQLGGGLVVDGLVHELLGTMDRHAQRPERVPPSWLARALEMLHDRYVEDLSIAEVAAAVGVHPVHLARSFRQHFRCTPGDFSRFRRLEMAAQLLARSARSLAEIAVDCGFADQSHFNKVFVRALGLAPGEFRRVTGTQRSRPGTFQIDKNAPESLARIRAQGAAARRYARNPRWRC